VASTKWTQSISLRGSSFLTGNGAPTNALGQDGDSYLNLETFDLYSAKSGGAWPTEFANIRGPAGDAGGAGSASGGSIITGAGAPSDANGADGDLFYSTDTTTIFGPKAGGTWPTPGTSLIGSKGDKGDPGAPGTPGTVITSGTGEPDDSVGVAGGYYLDASTGRLYGPKSA